MEAPQYRLPKTERNKSMASMIVGVLTCFKHVAHGYKIFELEFANE